MWFKWSGQVTHASLIPLGTIPIKEQILVIICIIYRTVTPLLTWFDFKPGKVKL